MNKLRFFYVDKCIPQKTEVTAYLDLHPIYGKSDAENRNLRTLRMGLLKVDIENGQEWFTNSPNPALDCFAATNPTVCFRGGNEFMKSLFLAFFHN